MHLELTSNNVPCASNFIGGNGGMADAPDLGSGAARCGGSSPLSRTTLLTELSGLPEGFFIIIIISDDDKNL